MSWVADPHPDSAVRSPDAEVRTAGSVSAMTPPVGPELASRSVPADGIGPKEAGGVAVAGVQHAGMGSWAGGVGEIALKALGDQDRGHLRVPGKDKPTA